MNSEGLIQRGILDQQPLPFFQGEASISPLAVSEKIQKQLDHLRQEATRSLEWIPSIQMISKSLACKDTIQKYEEKIWEVDAFANFLLTADEVKDEDLKIVNKLNTELQSLQNQFDVVDNNDLNPDFSQKAKEGIAKAREVLVQLQSVAETLIHYQKKLKPLENSANEFCKRWDTNPLYAAHQLPVLIDSLLTFNDKILNKGFEDSLRGIKLRDAHETQMKSLQNELEYWVYDTEKELEGQIKHLKFLLKHADPVERKKAGQQLAALTNHLLVLAHLLRNSLKESSLLLPDFSKILNKASTLKKLGQFDAANLKYGSEKWEKLVKSRPTMPQSQGFLSRVYSFFDTANWSPASLQIANVFFLAARIGQEVVGMSQRINDVKDLKRRADEMQKAVFNAVPEEQAQRIQIEATLIDTILDRGLDKVNIKDLTHKYPEALPTLEAVSVKFGTNPTKEQIAKVVKDHVTARMVAASPIGNPYAEQWARVWPNCDLSAATSTNNATQPIIEDIGMVAGLLDTPTIQPTVVGGIVNEVDQVSNQLTNNFSNVKDTSFLIRDLNRIKADIPGPKNSIEKTIHWALDSKKFIREAEKSLVSDSVSPSSSLSLLEEKYHNENAQLIRTAIDLPAQAPTDNIYANLIMLYRPDAVEASIEGRDLQGLPAIVPLKYLLDTQKAYLQALNAHPEFSTACRREACHAIFGNSTYSELAIQDNTLIQDSIKKIEFSEKIYLAADLEKSRLIETKFNELAAGENFFFETHVSGSKVGHAVIFEIEKDQEGQATLRVFNTGTGLQYHGSGETQFEKSNLPFFEMVDIVPERLFGGSFTSFLNTINEGNKDWSKAIFYEVILASIGGKVSSRNDSASLLREIIYAGNCGTASGFAILDKTAMSAGLAERMRALTLYRATKAYYGTNLQEISSGKNRESKRRLLLAGTQAAYEAIQRAIEVGGLVGQEVQELLGATKKIQAAVTKLQHEDLGLADTVLSLSDQKKLFVDALEIDTVDIAVPSVFGGKKESSKTEEKRPTARKNTPTFVPFPFKDKTLERLNEFGKQLSSQNDAANQAAIVTSLDFNELFEMGFQHAKGLIIASNIEALKITDHLGLFSQSLANFFDNDKMRILQELLLDPKVLEMNLAYDQGLISAVNKFCGKGRKLGSLTQNAAVESYFAYLSKSFYHALKVTPHFDENELSKASFLDSTQIFIQLIADSDPVLETERLKIIHFYRIKSFETYQQLTVVETGELLSSINYLLTQGYPKEFTDAAKSEIQRIWDLVEVSHNHLDQVESRGKILNQIATGLDPEHKECSWKQQEEYDGYVNDDQTMFYHPGTGILDKQAMGRTETPQILKNDPLFCAVVDNVEERLERLKENIFLYKDAQENAYRFIISGNTIAVQRKFNSEWYQAVDAKGLVASKQPDQKHWHEAGVLWAPVSQNGEFYYTGPKEFPVLHLAELKETGLSTSSVSKFLKGVQNTFRKRQLECERVTAALEKTGMKLIDISASSFTNVIGRIEDPKYTFSFAKDGEMLQIIWPRWDLEFAASDSSEKRVLASKKLDGFGLFAGKQALTLFGDFTDYLPLKKIGENGREEFGVLIPFAKFSPQITDGLKTPTTLVKASGDWNEKIPYFFYRLQGDTLVPEVSSSQQAIQANLHVATIFLSERRYEEAQKYLSIMDRLLKSSVKFDEALAKNLVRFATFFSVNQDQSPDAAALRLRAQAIAKRLIGLSQIVPVEIPSIKIGQINEYQFYFRHLTRVSEAFRLSKEENQLLTQFAPFEKNEISEYAFPISKIIEAKVEHRPLNIHAEQKVEVASHDTFSLMAKEFSQLKESAGNLIVSKDPLFINAFPEGILPLYSLLKNPANIGLAERIKLAHQYGLDPLISTEGLRSSMVTLIEMRYRFLADTIKLNPEAKENKLRENQIELLNSEMNLIGTLITTSLGKNRDASTLTEEATKHRELVATLRTIPKYSKEIYAYDKLFENLSGDALEEALHLWNDWVTPNVLPLDLSIPHSSKESSGIVGPFLTEPLIELGNGPMPLDFAFSYAALYQNRPATMIYNTPVASAQELSSCFKKETEKLINSPSPFSLNIEDPVISKVFKENEHRYQQFLADSPTSKINYELVDNQRLTVESLKLKEGTLQIRGKIAKLEQTLTSKLNRSPSDPSLKMHRETRLARGVLRELTLDDAKAALAKGWDIEHLKSLNPNLSLSEAQEIFELTLTLLLERREAQKRTRIANAIDDVLKEEDTSPLWQKRVDDLMRAINEKSHYDPYDHPVLLLAETEFDLALWAEQVPAIMQLAPRSQISSLIELAMGLGKTDVISPPVLCLLADGTTLPILVMPEALLPSVAARLQERMGDGFNGEIRVIPVDRGVWPVERIDALREELSRATIQRIPLVWSSTDIQTLINSYIESMEEMSKTQQKDLTKVAAWKKLFTFLRSSAEIIGDEIHAILDILTSYNFAMGTPSPLSKDEMDAVADFIKVVVTHPAVMNKVSLPFLNQGEGHGIPLTEEYFKTVLVDQLISTLIERGITNDQRCKELFAGLNLQNRQLVREYLSSSSQAQDLKEHRFFPAIDMNVVTRIEEKRSSETEIKNLLSKLLPNDKLRLEKLLSHKFSIVPTLKQLHEEYQALEGRVHNFLASQKESLRIVFPLTAMAQKGKHYVLNKDGTSAIPAENGTPLWDAQFGSSLERLYYTAFLFSQESINEDMIRKDLEIYVKKYQKLVAETLDGMPDGELDEQLFNDPLIKEFEARYGTSVHLKERGFTEVEIQQLTTWVNEKIERQIPFIRDYIFIEQTNYQQEIETTTHMFSLIAKPKIGLKGMSGTLYNLASSPKVFTDAPHLSDTTPKIIQRTIMSGPEKTFSVDISGTPEEIIKKLYSNSSFGPGSIIDTTGYMRKEMGESYARAMLKDIHEKDSGIEGLVYYDEDILKVIYSEKQDPSLYDSTVSPNKLAAFWDVAHTTGSNILIHPTAHAILVVGKHLRLFEFLQASMRLRGLGAGQRLEIAVADRAIIAEKLLKYLNIKIEEGQPLSLTHIFQYALLNEILEETGNNWRAVDMRMKMVLLTPIMGLLWDENISDENSLKIFDLIKGLFLNNKSASAAEQYGQPILKVPAEKGMQDLLNGWLAHPILEAVKNNPQLFRGIDAMAIVEQLKAISKDDPGPIQPLVDTQSTVKMRQRTKNKVQDKVKLHIKTHVIKKEKIKDRTQLFVKQRKIEISNTIQVPLRRKPYQPLPVLPFSDPFSRSSYHPLPLNEAINSEFDALQPKKLAERGAGSLVKMSDLLSLDSSLSNCLQVEDEGILVSLNLAPVWSSPKSVSPLYAPYHVFHKFATHALLIHDEMSNSLKLELIDANDAKALLEKLKQDRIDNKRHDVNLSLYHLQEGRIIASGATPINPKDLFVLNERKTELIAQAKLLSGMIHYTNEEIEFLDKWIKHRDPKKILGAFVFKIALHREEALEDFVKSNLGKLFQRQGIVKKEIESIIQNPEVKYVKDIYSLMFNKNLSPEEWFDIAHRVKNSISSPTTESISEGMLNAVASFITGFMQFDEDVDPVKAYAAKWSDVLVPLLPVLFDVLQSNGASTWPDAGFINPDKTLNVRAAQRRWLMNTFFPTVADEFGAWRTAIPALRGKIPNSASLSFNDKDDADFAYLEATFKDDRSPSVPSKASIDQLETLSELAHPIWGLPLLADSASAGEFRGMAEKIKNMRFSDLKIADDMFEDVVDLSYKHHESAQIIANHALSQVDMVASLKSIAHNSDYQFERLYGIFAYLAKQNLSPEARREYALLMIPGVFGNLFGNDMRFYTQFIPNALTVDPEAYSTGEINDILDQSFRRSQVTKDWLFTEGDESNPTSKERTLTLRAFAKDAPTGVANTTAAWTNLLLEANPQEGWWIDTLLFQLLTRTEALINYQFYRAYFDRSLQVDHIAHAFIMDLAAFISSSDQVIITAWKLKDFDLYSDLAELKLVNSPTFTPYQMANKWVDALKDAKLHKPSKGLWDHFLNAIALGNANLHEPSEELWGRILDGIAKAVQKEPPNQDADKEALRTLLNVLDDYSLHVSQESFVVIQDKLGPIRLAADFSFDLRGRQKGAMDEIKKLPTRDDNSHKVYHYFITHFLLPQAEASHISPEALNQLFTDLHQLKESRYSLVDWENLYNQILDSFSFEGTVEQTEASSKWVSLFLESKPQASLISDILVKTALTHSIEKVEHKHLVDYVKGREAAFISLLQTEDKELVNFSNGDFELFAELFQLKTAHRIPLSHSVFAKKMTNSITSAPKHLNTVLAGILNAIHERGLAVSEESRDKKAISELIHSVDRVFSSISSQKLMDASNQLRLLSDFSDLNPNVNMQKAVADLFTPDKSMFRLDAIHALVPILLAKTKNSEWVSTSLKNLLNTVSKGRLSYHQEKILDRMMKESNILPGLIDQMLPTVKTESEVLNYFLSKLSPDLSKISHASLKAYFELVVDKSAFLHSLNKKGENWVEKSNSGKDHFDIFAEFAHLKTHDRPVLKLETLVQWTDANYYDLKDSAISAVLQKLIGMPPANQQERASVSNLIKKLDTIILAHGRGGELNQLRLQTDFIGTPHENILKAINELLDLATSDERKKIYETFVVKDLFRATDNRPVLFSKMLDEVDGDQSTYAKNVIELILKMLRSDGSSAAYKAVDIWLKQQCSKASFSPTAFELFLSLTEKHDLNYPVAEQVWKKMNDNQKKLWLSSLRTDFYDLKLYKFLVAEFSVIVNCFKVPLSEDKSTLSTAIESALFLISANSNRETVKAICKRVVNKLPSSFLGFFAGKLSEGESEEVRLLVEALKAKNDARYKSCISQLESAL